ncbi:MAG: DUF167 domain-containing protein [archaeon]|nr:DUF167 domain-containing protein [archaeon]
MPKEMVLGLSVNANARQFKIVSFDRQTNSLKVKTKAPALKGAANKEIEKTLRKILGAKTVIVSGHKSKNKKILVEKKESAMRFLESL